MSASERNASQEELNRQLVALRSPDVDERELAWRRLMDQHYGRIYRLVCRFGIHPGEVEDVVQRALIIAFRRIQEVNDVRDPAAWLRGITVRVVSQHRRWWAVREAKRYLLPESSATADPVITPEQSASAAQEVAAVRTVLYKLSPKLRDVLVLCDIEELKPTEVAQLLGISTNTVRSRRRLAKAKFHTIWDQRKDKRL